MEKELRFYYDRKGDVLDVSIGKPEKALTEEISEDIFVRINPKSDKIVGFMILNFTKSFLKQLETVKKPIVAKMRR